jgi:hypothetical protein
MPCIAIPSASKTLALLLRYLNFCFSVDSPFTQDFVAILLELDEEDVYLHLSELHSILYIPPPPNTINLEIRPSHASLQNFLFDKLRSGKYFLDEEAFHVDLTQAVRTSYQYIIHESSIGRTLVWKSA